MAERKQDWSREFEDPAGASIAVGPPRRGWNGLQLSAFNPGAGRRRSAHWNGGPGHPPLGPLHSETKSPATGRAVREYFHRAEMSIRPC
jgi:hypothetical protein